MGTLVIAIETVGNEDEALTKEIESTVIHNEKTASKPGLSPLTGQIVALAMYDLERELGAVYFVTDDLTETFTDDSFTYKQRTERQILEDFWAGANDYDVFVTFNGRAFTLPFLYHRSIILGVKPKVEISMKQYLNTQNLPYHVDLLEEFTFHGAMKPRPSLALLAKANSIEYMEKIRGDEVDEAFKQKKFMDIARRCSTDVFVIKSLYMIWKANLAPLSFINAIEM
jgi:DNA polymerase elongation subunit (family B)